MDLTLSVFIICALCFFFAGFIDSIAGGGGLITLPSLLLCGVPAHYALGTGKLAGGLGSITALVTFWRGKLIDRRVAPIGFVSSFLGAVAGSWLALQIESSQMERILIFMLPIGLMLSLLCGGIKLEDTPVSTRFLLLKVSLIGLIVGLYDGFFGPGAGSFFLLGLHLTLKMGLVKSSANAKVFNIASNLGSVCTFASGGTVLYALALPCAVASILGNRLGAKYAMRVGPRFVRNILYFVLTLLMCSLLFRTFCLN